MKRASIVLAEVGGVLLEEKCSISSYLSVYLGFRTVKLTKKSYSAIEKFDYAAMLCHFIKARD